MINIDDMAKMIEAEKPDEGGKTPPETPPETPPSFTEERAAEMIETALSAKSAEYAKTIEGLTNEIATLKNTIAALAEKGAGENA